MQFVVTGGAGFIGSRLAAELLNLGEVTVVDDLSSGTAENLRRLPKELRFLQGDVTDPALLRRAFEGADCIFHLAAIASVQRSLADPAGCHEVNATGTLRVLSAARDCGAKKVIFASSAAVYGNPPALPLEEKFCPVPLSPYAASKAAGEHLCAAFTASYGLETAVLRYFNVYGPGQDPHAEYAAVVPQFLLRALTGKAPVIHGTGDQTRDFVYVGDVVRGTILALQRDAGGIFNIGSGTATSVSDLARQVLLVTGSTVEPVHGPARKGEVLHSVASISRTARVMGYQPRWTLAQGLGETATWYRDRLSAGGD